MTYHTNITFKYGNRVIGTDTVTVRGRWLGNAEHKAMLMAERNNLYWRSDNIRFHSTPVGGGKTASMVWILCHPVRS